jgi:hypothetical protein
LQHNTAVLRYIIPYLLHLTTHNIKNSQAV